MVEPSHDKKKYTLVTLVPILTTMQTTAVYFVTCLVDTVKIASMPTILSVEQHKFWGKRIRLFLFVSPTDQLY